LATGRRFDFNPTSPSKQTLASVLECYSEHFRKLIKHALTIVLDEASNQTGSKRRRNTAAWR
jgi:hypothetical protein